MLCVRSLSKYKTKRKWNNAQLWWMNEAWIGNKQSSWQRLSLLWLHIRSVNRLCWHRNSEGNGMVLFSRFKCISYVCLCKCMNTTQLVCFTQNHLWFRYAPWPGQMRRGGCCGWWRRKLYSPEALKKLCSRDCSDITALLRTRAKVRTYLLHITWHNMSFACINLCLMYPSGPALLLKSEKPHHFLLGHSHGTDWVEYDARGWLCHAKQNPASQNAATLLQDSQK